MKIGEAYVDVRAKDDKLKPDLRKAERDFEQTTNRMQQDADSINFKQAGAAVMAFAVVFSVAMYKTVDAASDLEETVGKFNVVFSDQLGLADKWSKELVGSYAMSTIESKKYLSAMQDLLVPMGMQTKLAGQMSFEVVKLAADLGSFNNLPTAQVMLDIQSAMVGNYETMKKYGVVLKASTVENRALADGIIKTKDELTAGIKAQMAYKMIVEGSAFAIGDMDRTMASYANQMKLFKATVVDVATSYGNNLLPAATEFLVFLNTDLPKAYNFVMGIGVAFTGSILENFIHIEYAAKTSWEGVRLAQFKAMDEMKLAWANWTEGVVLATALVMPVDALQSMIDFAAATRASVVGKESFAEITSRLTKEKEAELDIHKKLIDAMYAEIYASNVLIDKAEGKQSANEILFAAELAAMEERARKLGEQKEWEDEVLKEFEKVQLKKLDIQADFDVQYADMGKSRFDIERAQLDRQVEIWREAGIKKNKIDKLVADKSRAISKAESEQRLSDMHSTVGMMTNGFQMISDMGGKHSKKAFAMYKAFKIVEVTIATYSAAIKAYESLVGIPFIGPYVAPAAAAAAVTFGMAQVGMIQGSSPPSYDEGGISEAKGVYQTGNIREAHIPLKRGKVPVEIAGAQAQPQFNIIMENPVFQDVETQRRAFVQLAEVVAAKVAPGAVVQNYKDGLEIRQMVRGGM